MINKVNRFVKVFIGLIAAVVIIILILKESDTRTEHKISIGAKALSRMHSVTARLSQRLEEPLANWSLVQQLKLSTKIHTAVARSLERLTIEQVAPH